GTEAILQLLERLSSNNDSLYQNIYENVTVVAVPKFNPDGSELVQRTNSLTWDEVVKSNTDLKDAEAPPYYRSDEKGFDINRDFNPNFDYELKAEDLPGTGSDPGFFLTNEAKA